MNKMALFLVLALSLSCVTLPERSSWLQTIQSSYCVAGQMNYGTGFPVAAEPNPDGSWRVLFLTPKHVATFPPGGPFEILSDGVLVGTGVLHAVHPKIDAALVLVTMAERPYLPPLRFSLLREGEQVYHSGYGGGNRGHRWISLGIASAPNRASTYISPGDSGAPIIDVEGRIAAYAVYVGGLPDGVHLILGHSFLVPLAAIEDWLKEEASRLQSPPEPEKEKGSSVGASEAE